MLSLLCAVRIIAGRVADRLRNRLVGITDRVCGEEGASTVEWVIITGFLIVLAAVVGKAIYSMVNNASSNLQVPDIGNGGGGGNGAP